MTEGQYLVDSAFHNNTGSTCQNTTCNVCFHDATGRSYSDSACGSGKIHIMRGNPSSTFLGGEAYNGGGGTGEAIAHEFGHLYLCMYDEYADDGYGNSLMQCGHTVMANPYLANNLCYYESTGNHTHKEDKDPNASATSVSAGWSVVPGTPTVYTDTPDNWNYANHEFDGMLDCN